MNKKGQGDSNMLMNALIRYIIPIVVIFTIIAIVVRMLRGS